jgi:hypothetical protein
VNDALASVFPVKYRWPVFQLDASPLEDYKSITDEECKVRARTPHVSKFRHMPFDFSDDERCRIYVEEVKRTGRSTGNNVAAFFRATFEAWKDYRRSGGERLHVGYSPIITVDSEKILRDVPGAHVLHVVRNPWSAYADTCKRPVPLSLENYMLGWTLSQYFALLFRARYPERVHIVRVEDLMEDPKETLGVICGKMGLDTDDSLAEPTWNGSRLKEIYPWGTIRTATPEANLATAKELGGDQVEEIRHRARPYLEAFGYSDFL